MFEDSTFESAGRIRTRSRGWMIAALALNGSVLFTLILIPLIYPEALPSIAMFHLMAVPPPPAAAPRPVNPPEQQFHGTSQMHAGQIVAPVGVPILTRIFDGPEQAPPGSDLIGMDSGASIPGGTDSPFRSNTVTHVVQQPPKGPMAVSSGVMTGQLIYKVTPLYPPIAVAARAEGTVVLQAIISKTGAIENLRVVGGPGLLQQAALDAVKQWRYRPYQLNGQPVEVETTINVVFTLGR